MRSDRNKTIVIHAGAWVLFIGYEVSIALLLGSRSGWLEFAVFYLLNIALFYAVFKLFFYIYNTENINNGLQLSLILIVILFVYTLAYVVLVGVLVSWKVAGVYPVSTNTYIEGIWRGVYFIGLSLSYSFARRSFLQSQRAKAEALEKLDIERANTALQSSLMTAEMAYLKAQIAPHMLFNTLNYVYNAVYKTAPDAAIVLQLLSETLRYAIKGSADGMVTLGEELKQIDHLRKIYEFRFPAAFYMLLTIDVSEKDHNVKILPLTILTLFENVLKHGDLTISEVPATVNIHADNGQLTIRTQNVIRPSRHANGTGMTNLRQRLQNRYGADAYTLIQQQEKNLYTVTLILPL